MIRKKIPGKRAPRSFAEEPFYRNFYLEAVYKPYCQHLRRLLSRFYKKTAVRHQEPLMSESDTRPPFKPGDIVQHFKHELYPADTPMYTYRVLGYATHS